MKTKIFFAIALIGAFCAFAPQLSRAQDIDSMAPVVVKTIPEAGAKDVAPGVVEIKVIFSKEMWSGSWNLIDAWMNSSPEIVESPRIGADRKSWVVKVKLEPNKIYGCWLNSRGRYNLRDSMGQAAVPYLLTFQTKGE